VAALVIGFIPPAQFGHSNPLTYAIEILAGILAIGIDGPPPQTQLEGSRRRLSPATTGPAPVTGLRPQCQAQAARPLRCDPRLAVMAMSWANSEWCS
jgi:hypothetical protein